MRGSDRGERRASRRRRRRSRSGRGYFTATGDGRDSILEQTKRHGSNTGLQAHFLAIGGYGLK